jgi:hypothetical protein
MAFGLMNSKNLGEFVLSSSQVSSFHSRFFSGALKSIVHTLPLTCLQMTTSFALFNFEGHFFLISVSAALTMR